MAFFHVIIKHQHELFTTVRLIRAKCKENSMVKKYV